MSETLRQTLYRIKDWEEVKYHAVLGTLSGAYNGSTTPGISYKVLFGDSSSLAADADKEIWPNTNNMAVPTNAEVLSVVSSSVEDDNGGTGIDMVYIEGLDDDYCPINETIVLNGTAAVTGSKLFRHVYEINCLNLTTSGSANIGNITVTNGTSGDLLGYVAAGDSISKHSQFMVPSGYNAVLLSMHNSCFRTSGSGAKRAQIDLVTTPYDGGAANGIDFNTLKTGVSSDGSIESTFHLPLVFGEKILIHPHAIAESNNTQVTIQYEMLLIDAAIDIDSIF